MVDGLPYWNREDRTPTLRNDMRAFGDEEGMEIQVYTTGATVPFMGRVIRAGYDVLYLWERISVLEMPGEKKIEQERFTAIPYEKIESYRWTRSPAQIDLEKS